MLASLHDNDFYVCETFAGASPFSEQIASVSLWRRSLDSPFWLRNPFDGIRGMLAISSWKGSKMPQ